MSKASKTFPVPDPSLEATLNQLQIEIGIVAFARAMENSQRDSDTLDIEVSKLIAEVYQWLDQTSKLAMQDAQNDFEKLKRSLSGK